MTPTLTLKERRTFNRSSETPVDLTRIGRITGGSRARVDEFINLYLQSSTSQLIQLTQAVEQRVYKQMRMTAHSCLGASKLIGANGMIPPLEALEQLGAEHSVTGAKELLHRTWKELERIQFYFHPMKHRSS
jgi:HPt (histidine-containing phosphotransfer) domain-containing protein